jgi:hypothetical protein
MSVSMSVPLDSDGFGRRECPNCEQEFKWRFDDEGEADEHVYQYYCPLCGQPAGVGSWWTTEQVEHMRALVMPDALGQVQDLLDDSFKSNEHVTYERSQDLGDLPIPIVLVEPDDMVMISSPCHQSEPVKVPEEAEGPFHCLVCGQAFAV